MEEQDDDSSLYDEEVSQLSPPKTKLAVVEGARSSDDKEPSLNRFRNMVLLISKHILHSYGVVTCK